MTSLITIGQHETITVCSFLQSLVFCVFCCCSTLQGPPRPWWKRCFPSQAVSHWMGSSGQRISGAWLEDVDAWDTKNGPKVGLMYLGILFSGFTIKRNNITHCRNPYFQQSVWWFGITLVICVIHFVWLELWLGKDQGFALGVSSSSMISHTDIRISHDSHRDVKQIPPWLPLSTFMMGGYIPQRLHVQFIRPVRLTVSNLYLFSMFSVKLWGCKRQRRVVIRLGLRVSIVCWPCVLKGMEQQWGNTPIFVCVISCG